MEENIKSSIRKCGNILRYKTGRNNWNHIITATAFLICFLQGVAIASAIDDLTTVPLFLSESTFKISSASSESTIDNGDGTYTFTQRIDRTSGIPHYYGPWNTGQGNYGFEYYSWFNQDYGWNHTFPNHSLPDMAITSAHLTIRAWDVDSETSYGFNGEYDGVTGDGNWLDPQYLQGQTDVWSVTLFNVDPGSLLDGNLSVWLDIDMHHTSRTWATTVNYSILSVNYSFSSNNPPFAPELAISPVGCTNSSDNLVVNVTGPALQDPDGDSVSFEYRWFVDTGTGFFVDDEFAGRGDHTGNVVPAANIQNGDIWRVEVIAVDEHNTKGTSSTVTFAEIGSCLTPPIANAGGDRTSDAAVVTLNGSNSYDPDGMIASYLWELFTGSSWISIGTSEEIIYDFGGMGTYQVRLTVIDNTGLSSSSDAYITISYPQLNVSVSESPDPVLSGATSNVTVHVETGGSQVSNASVYVSATEGILSPLSGVTDSNGDFKPLYTAPSVSSSMQYTIFATAIKAGYMNGSGYDLITVYPQLTTGTISGTVWNESSGLGISGALVKLTLYPQYNATTLSDGSYIIPDVPNGVYDILAMAAGYTKNSSTVNVTESTVNKDFSLAVGSITGDYRYYSLIDNEITANKVSSSSDIGRSFIIPQYGNGVTWNTQIYVTDVSGLGATLTLDYYRVDGSHAITETPSVPANGTYRWMPSDGTNGRPAIGKLVITSNNDIVGEFVISSTSNSDIISNKLYDAADYATSLSIPQYGDNTAWDTYIAISDVSGLGANLTLRFYRPDGTLAVTETKTVLPNGLYKELPISDGRNGRPKMGRLEIESDHLITGEYRVYSLGNGGILSNKLYKPSDKKTSFTVPQYGNHLTWDTYLAISDASGLGANLTMRYYYPNGTLAVTETRTVPANGLYKDNAISDGTNGRPTIGKLEITSDNIVFGELRIYSLSGRGIMSNSLYNQPDISSKVIVPYYGNNVGLGTKVNLADVSGLGLNVQVDYHYLNGVTARTEYLTIPADGLEAYIVSDGSNGKPTEGNMFISMLP